MRLFRQMVAASAILIALGGCAFSDSGLIPSLGGDDEAADAGDTAARETQQSQADQRESATREDRTAQRRAGEAAQAPTGRDTGPRLGTTVFEPRELPDFQPSDTFVGKKVANLRGDLERLQDSIAQHNRALQNLRRQTISAARGYHERVGDINARLQVGTTPGNPELVSMWNNAQMDLARVDSVVNEMDKLANDAASTSAMAAFLLDSVEASYSLSGAIEKDHEHLAILEDGTNRTVVLIDRLLNELSEDIARQNSYLSRERSNLSTLSLAIREGEFYGTSLANQAYGPAPPPSETPAQERIQSQQPLVVIRFGSGDVAYERPLYNAVSRALEQRPQAAFDVVAVAPQSSRQGETSLNRARVRRFAERVLRALNEMGLPPERVSVSATTSQNVEEQQVHVYVR